MCLLIWDNDRPTQCCHYKTDWFSCILLELRKRNCVTKPKLSLFAGLLSLALLGNSSSVAYQNKTAPVTPANLMKRTAIRHESIRFGYGGTVTVLGAPKGSVKIEAWQRNEIDLTAEIEWQAPTEDDLNLLVPVNNFAIDDDSDHLRILTTGTHDRVFMKKVNKNFPKRLLNLPWKVDYRLRVPVATDVEIDAGHGPVTLSGIEGALRVNATEGDVSLTLTGGSVSVTIAAGTVNLSIPTRSWRGGGVEVRIAAGTLNVELPAGFNGDIDADVLRVGKIVNSYEGLETREKPGITESTIRARAGSGGAFFRFTVGDGIVNIRKASQ